MPQSKLNSKIKKNLLDLQYNKYLQYYNTSIIILVTYIIGVFIAIITEQVNYKNLAQMNLVAIISFTVISIILMLMIRFKGHLTNIPKEIKKLKI